MRASVAGGLLWMLAASGAGGQEAAGGEPKAMLRRVEDALRAGEVVKAAELATRLDEEVQRRFRASLVADAAKRVDEALAWLPADTEAMFVLQRPFVVNSGELQTQYFSRPAEYYALDRLAVLDQGRVLRQLDGATMRIVIAAVKEICPRAEGLEIPAQMPEGEAAFLYYFTAPIEAAVLGSPDEMVGAIPVWMRTAELTVRERVVPGSTERPKRIERTWLALVRPDVLAAASSREALTAMLGRMRASGQAGQQRALAGATREWALADRSASFWGVRHYPAEGNRRRCVNADATSDPLLLGLAVRFDADSGAVETRFVHGGEKPPRVLAQSGPGIDFEAERGADGVWRLRSNIGERGPFPFHLAAGLLGFGGSR